MHFAQTLCYFQKNNARNITYMTVLIFLGNLNFRQNAYSRTSSSLHQLFPMTVGDPAPMNDVWSCSCQERMKAD
jgi:hypothetical protein